MKETVEQKKSRVEKIIAGLRKAYGGVGCALRHSNPLELLVAVILSAQCTDKRVNLVTPSLFKKYRTAEDYANSNPKTFEEEIRSTGFYKNKARNIIACAKELMARHGGRVPDTMEALVKLPGVGRKTANAVLGNAFGLPGICVDTHMIRINRRLGLTKNSDPVKIEFDLMPIVPEKEWTDYSHLIIHHGRVRCPARKPDCAHCVINELCPSAFKVDSKTTSSLRGGPKARRSPDAASGTGVRTNKDSFNRPFRRKGRSNHKLIGLLRPRRRQVDDEDSQ